MPSFVVLESSSDGPLPSIGNVRFHSSNGGKQTTLNRVSLTTHSRRWFAALDPTRGCMQTAIFVCDLPNRRLELSAILPSLLPSFLAWRHHGVSTLSHRSEFNGTNACNWHARVSKYMWI